MFPPVNDSGARLQHGQRGLRNRTRAGGSGDGDGDLSSPSCLLLLLSAGGAMSELAPLLASAFPFLFLDFVEDGDFL